jgi:hypothetical protein
VGETLGSPLPVARLALDRPYLAADRSAAPVAQLGPAAAAAGRVEDVGETGPDHRGETQLRKACKPHGYNLLLGVDRPLPSRYDRTQGPHSTSGPWRP